jgi:hypothetical protein
MFLFVVVVETTKLFWPENLKGKDFGRPPLWSSGQSSWLQIQRSGFNSRHYQIIWLIVGLERGPLSPMSTTEELLGRKSSGSGLENREYGREDLLRWSADTLYPQNLALTSPTSGDRSVGIVCSRTKAIEFSYYTQKHILQSSRHIHRQRWSIGDARKPHVSFLGSNLQRIAGYSDCSLWWFYLIPPAKHFPIHWLCQRPTLHCLATDSVLKPPTPPPLPKIDIF